MSKESSAAGILAKLEQLHMTKTVTNGVNLKCKLFGFKMGEDRSIDECINEFSKTVIDLENIGVEVDDEEQAIMILNSLPASYYIFVETMKHARESISLEVLRMDVSQIPRSDES